MSAGGRGAADGAGARPGRAGSTRGAPAELGPLGFRHGGHGKSPGSRWPRRGNRRRGSAARGRGLRRHRPGITRYRPGSAGTGDGAGRAPWRHRLAGTPQRRAGGAELPEGLGGKGPLEVTASIPPAARCIFNQIRLFGAPSNLTLNVSRHNLSGQPVVTLYAGYPGEKLTGDLELYMLIAGLSPQVQGNIV